VNKKKIIGITLVTLMIVILALPALGASPEGGNSDFGWLSLLPPVLAIILAFITKQVLLSLFLGIFTGAMMLNGWNPFLGFLRTLDEFMVGSLADAWYASIIIFTLTIGGMIGIIGRMGGTKAVAEALAKKAKTSRSAQVVTAILGVLVFFDDYANTLIVGPTMRPLSDKMKISREKLAYIVDSTAAPVVGMAFISTWVGYELGLIRDAYGALGVDVNVFEMFIKTLPYAFYNIFALVLVFTLALSGRDYGPMLKAEKRARLTGKVLADGAKPMANDEATKVELKEGIKLKASNAIVPIVTLVVVSFAGLWYNGYLAAIDDGLSISAFSWEGMRESFGYADAGVVLIWGAITASIVAGVMAISQKILSLSETFDAWVEGSKALLITGMILVLAWSLGAVTEQVGTADFLVGIVSDKIPGGFLPIIVFVISGLVAFATGTSWGTMAIVIPLAIPLANSYVSGDPASSALIIATLSSVLSGSIFGDHCSPISDTTIMSSMASASDHIDHVKTQAPYAVTGAVLAMLAYLVVGFLQPSPLITLIVGAIGAVLIVLFVKFVGKKVDEEALEYQKNK